MYVIEPYIELIMNGTLRSNQGEDITQNCINRYLMDFQRSYSLTVQKTNNDIDNEEICVNNWLKVFMGNVTITPSGNQVGTVVGQRFNSLVSERVSEWAGE